jgi:hypothetical protein
MFVDYTGQTVELLDGPQGRDQTGAGSVAVMGASSYLLRRGELDADPSGLDRLARPRAGFHGAPSRASSIRLRARPVLSYRACEFAAGVGGWPAIIGGLSIPYATIPMNKRTGMTIGGTKYFMVFPLLENWIGGSSRHHFSNAAGAPCRSLSGTWSVPHYNMPKSSAAARATQASSIIA